MSIKLMTLVWDLDLPQAEKIVLLSLADNASDQGHCFPSISFMVRRCGQSERNIHRVITRLAEAGHITIKPRNGRSSVYEVHPKTVEQQALPLTPRHPCQGGTPATMAPTPDTTSPPPLTPCQVTPATMAPITVRESPSESSPNRGGRASRLPDDFELTPERREIAKAEKLDPDRTFKKFCNHWRSASGAKARKVDWDATWSNWCMTEADITRPAAPRGGGAPGGYTATVAELDAAALGQLKARRAALGLPDFRDPLPRESASDYRKAQDEAWERKRDQDMQRSKRTQLDAIAAAGDALRKVKA